MCFIADVDNSYNFVVLFIKYLIPVEIRRKVKVSVTLNVKLKNLNNLFIKYLILIGQYVKGQSNCDLTSELNSYICFIADVDTSYNLIISFIMYI